MFKASPLYRARTAKQPGLLRRETLSWKTNKKKGAQVVYQGKSLCAATQSPQTSVLAIGEGIPVGMEWIMLFSCVEKSVLNGFHFLT